MQRLIKLLLQRTSQLLSARPGKQLLLEQAIASLLAVGLSALSPHQQGKSSFTSCSWLL